MRKDKSGTSAGTPKNTPFKQKHFSAKPRLDCHPKKHNEPKSNELALFLLAYSNRIMFKSAIQVRIRLQIPIYLNTIHIRYVLLLHFMAYAKREAYVALRAIELADWPTRSKASNHRIEYIDDLVRHALATKRENTGEKPQYALTEKGYKAIDIILAVVHLQYFTQPNDHKGNTHNIFTDNKKRIGKTDLSYKEL